MNALRRLGAEVDQIRVTGGGAKSGFWLGLLADLFGAPCTTLESDEGPAFGAAILAGVGIGIWPNVQNACEKTIRPRTENLPTGVDYSGAYHKYQELYRCTKDWNVG
jgi:xylulokinase